MGNCTASKLAIGDEDEAVAICRGRKRLIKEAVKRRYALADAHVRYTHSLNSVAAAINLFVTRHTTPAVRLITLPSPSPSSPSFLPRPLLPSSDPSFHRQTPTEANTKAVKYRRSSSSCSSSSSSSSLCMLDDHGMNGEMMGGNREMGCDYFFTGDVPPPPPSPPSLGRSFGWDFFDPFGDVRTSEEAVMMAGLGASSYGESYEELRVVREEEGIPELEEEEMEQETRKTGGGCNNGKGDGKVTTFGEEEEKKTDDVVTMVVEQSCNANAVDGGGGDGEKGLAVGDGAPTRELLDALRDVEDHFVRAYNSGKDVSRMLEANNKAHLSSIDEIKENSSKLIQAITWHRSPSSQSSSYRSFLASNSRSTSWTMDSGKSDLFDDCAGMESGSHSQTLERLYAWEKKLYQEVKAGDDTRKVYDRKCSLLRNQDAKGLGSRSLEKNRTAAKELYTRIFVAIRTAETISKRIDKLKDDELQPQLIELLHGLLRTWKIMLESHETQRKVIFEVKSFTCTAYGKFCSHLHRLATLQLDVELQNWRACFTNYITAQRAYVEALDSWLSKFVAPEVEFYSRGGRGRGRSSAAPFRIGAPPLLVICNNWLNSLKRLPDRPVSLSLKSFRRDVKMLWVKQGVEQQQKRKVDTLTKELDRRVVAFQKTENQIMESKICEDKSETDVRLEYLAGRKDMLDLFKVRLEIEKARHLDCMQETQGVTLNGFRSGFINVFESLSNFSRDSMKMYDELLIYNEKAKTLDESKDKQSCIEGNQAVVNEETPPSPVTEQVI